MHKFSNRTGARAVAILAGALTALAGAASSTHAQQPPQPRNPVHAEVVHVPAFDLPISEFLSEKTRAVLKRRAEEFGAMRARCPRNLSNASAEEIISRRSCSEKYYFPALIGRYRARYKVEIEPKTLGGVATEIITPAAGIPVVNRERVLINVHSGGFIGGGRWSGQLEAIPIAAVGKFKVIAVDYRLAPEYKFPAASEDVAAVYKALLRDYKPENIGIYGCSAGGVLTAEAVAWFQKEGLPRPGAIGMSCAGAFAGDDGDSRQLDAAISGPDNGGPPPQLSYFSTADLENPLASPGRDPAILAKFPPSLLITSSRDAAMSSVIVTHARLVKLGVKAYLHVWEGLGHAFYLEPDFPESREVYDVVSRFFTEHLGHSASQASPRSIDSSALSVD
jgi:epsilon-lactone hydrolase